MRSPCSTIVRTQVLRHPFTPSTPSTPSLAEMEFMRPCSGLGGVARMAGALRATRASPVYFAERGGLRRHHFDARRKSEFVKKLFAVLPRKTERPDVRHTKTGDDV